MTWAWDVTTCILRTLQTLAGYALGSGCLNSDVEGGWGRQPLSIGACWAELVSIWAKVAAAAAAVQPVLLAGLLRRIAVAGKGQHERSVNGCSRHRGSSPRSFPIKLRASRRLVWFHLEAQCHVIQQNAYA